MLYSCCARTYQSRTGASSYFPAVEGHAGLRAKRCQRHARIRITRHAPQVSSYYYTCVPVHYMCPHTTRSPQVSLYYYACPHTTKCVIICVVILINAPVLILYVYLSSYYYVSSYHYRSPHTTKFTWHHDILLCVLMPQHVSSNYFHHRCPDTTIYVSSYHYMCPHTALHTTVLSLRILRTTCVSSCHYTCVRILLHALVLILLCVPIPLHTTVV